MYILTIRTDNPEAELALYKEGTSLSHLKWEAHRALAETIHQKIEQLLNQHEARLSDLAGLVLYKGPGSFTGLRIGASVANALADGLAIPIIGATGADWVATGLAQLATGVDHKIVIPEYGAAPHITQQKR